MSSPRALCGLFFLFASAQCTQAEEAYFKFRDTHKEAGLSPDLAGMVAHSAAWGDVDGDGWADLYVGSFYKDGGIPSLLFRNNKGKFSLDGQENLRVQGRASGGVFADLDNDGDLDYYHSNNAIRLEGPEGLPNRLFRNEGGGKFTDITESSGAFRPGMTGRSVSVFDLDGDGLLDLLASEGPFRNKSKSSCIFRNKGNLKFEELDESIGLPTKIPALGTAVGDVNNDGWPDFFLASRHGSNRLFLNDGKGRFREAPGAHELFDNWKFHSGDGSTCGVVFGDVNRDGLLDVLMGSHYKRPWMRPAPIKLFLNRGIKDGNPSFEDVSVKAGLHPLALKAPHIEIQDFNNDGWPDIMVSIVKFADGKPYPVIFKHLGIRDGLPRFDENAMAVNDFPTATDRATGKTGEFYKKMEREKK
ncbi:MAG: VCBS repeat-containing protein, partial [Planctomycetota bacterium]|nr:VCBS repeat-containing protein [Planctomycetota bacterium]